MLSDEIRREILARSDWKGKVKGDRLYFRCPRHDDDTPSAWQAGGAWGCFACGFEESITTLAEPLGIALNRGGSGRWEDRIEATYDYVDESGALLYQAVRLFPKDFRQRTPDGAGGWSWKLNDVRRVLYRLPQVVEASALGKTVHVCEGEKDVHALESLGAVATTNPMGAGKWRREYSETLRGAHVRIVADRDEAGRKHAREVEASLEGVAASVELLEAREGKDAADHVARGYGLDDFVPMKDSDQGETPTGTQFATLGELLANPGMLDPPEPVVPRIAYRGHLTLLAAPDKAGKSTLMAHAATAVARGGIFLGDPTSTHTRRVLWVGLEESVKLAVQRFHDLGADPDRITLVKVTYPDLLDAAMGHLEARPADLVIVDSLQEYARVTTGNAPADGDNGAWGSIVRPLVALARTHDVAVVLLHHVRRSDLQARGAGEILAAADMLLEMARKKDGDPRARQFGGRGRWEVPGFSVLLDDGCYRLHDGSAASVDALTLDHISRHPGCSRNEVCSGVGKNRTTVLAAINRLVNAGTVMEEKAGRWPTLRVRDLELDMGAA